MVTSDDERPVAPEQLVGKDELDEDDEMELDGAHLVGTDDEPVAADADDDFRV